VKFTGTQFAVLLMDGYNVAASISDNAAMGKEIITEQTNPFGVTSEQHSPIGIAKGMLQTGNGFYDPETDELHGVLATLSGISRIICAAITGNVPGRTFMGYEGSYDQKYEVQDERDGLTKANVTYLVSGNVDQGVIVQDHATFTADWDTKTGGANAADTPVDNGASTANGGFAYFQVTAFSGFTGALLKIMHSPDDITYAALATSTSFTAIGAQRITVAPATTVDRYLSSNGDVTGSGSITAFSGFCRN
jgi:hypothetical protein